MCESAFEKVTIDTNAYIYQSPRWHFINSRPLVYVAANSKVLTLNHFSSLIYLQEFRKCVTMKETDDFTYYLCQVNNFVEKNIKDMLPEKGI